MQESGLDNIFCIKLNKYTEMTPHKIIKSNRKTLSISVNDNAELIVRAPKRVSNDQIKEFITEKANWINNKQILIRARLNNVKKEQNMQLYLGALFPIKISQTKDREIIFNGKEFITTTQNKDALNLSDSNIELFKKALSGSYLGNVGPQVKYETEFTANRWDKYITCVGSLGN